MTTLTKVWNQVELLLADGISIIPVRDKDETTKTGDVYNAKTPYKSWREYQTRIIDKGELWQQMEEKNTSAIAIICGKVSGNIEVIDIDVKYKPGIDAILLNDIRSFYPDLYSRLRIHKTPSSGYHIIYRVSGHDVPGNLKLAGRPASEDEIQLQISRGAKRPNKEVNFLETRGEGGYILAPPSLGYSVHKDNPIPVITWEERCSLITLCQSYTEIVKEAAKPKPSKSQSDFYDENPFEHFNRTVDPVELLEQFGWKFSHKNAHFIWFTRPDKVRGVSASWNLDKQIYYIFTSSTELQSEKGYHPATILAELKFSGDKSKTYHHLVQNGYGRVKRSIEETIVKRSALSGKSIPANFSADAKSQFSVIKEQLKQDHPFGVFIKYDNDDERYLVSRESLTYVAKELGFRYYRGELVRIEEFRINKVSERYFQDVLKDYIREEDADEYENLCNIYETFMQKNGSYTIKRLELLDESLLLRDTKDTAYKFFSNGYLTITSSEITFSTYENFQYCIWADKIQAREYRPGKGGKFVEFIKLATVDYQQAQLIYGFLSHEYKDETTGFIITLVEVCPDPKQGGGSGKNVYCNLLKLTTTYTSKPGAQAKFDEKFFQSWSGQSVFGISDVPKNFNFEFLKEPATGSFILKKLFKDEIEIGVSDAPKFIVQTNFSYEVTDGGLRRRIIPLEFTDFFTKCGGLDVHFGCHFPNGWTDEDYAGYDQFVAEGIQRFLQVGRKLSPTQLTETGWLKQWEQTYGNATGFILENWEKWLEQGYISNDNFKTSLEAFFNENNIQRHYWPSAKKLNDAIAAYSEKHDVVYVKDKSRKEFGGVIKCRYFYKSGESEPEEDLAPF